MEDLISVIIPVYNVEKYLPECIESIINQTYKKLEIILINDGSTDDSLEICNRYKDKDNRIIVINSTNKGASNARNLGIEASTGRYIAFIDSDDFIEKDYFTKMLEQLVRTNCDCVSCGYNRVYNNCKESILNGKKGIFSSDEFFEMILDVQTGMGFCHMKLWKSEIIKKSGINFNTNIKVAEDAFFCIQLSRKMKRVSILNEPLYNYRLNNQSLVKKYDANYVDKYLKAMIETDNYIKTNYNEDNFMTTKFYNYVCYHILLIIVNYCFNPENKKTKKMRIKELVDICNIELFKKSIKKSNYKGFSLTRKITLFTIKHKLYFITRIIAEFRQLQMRKK